jgi:hypothetical protein
MRSRQRGATLIGMVTIIAILGFALYAGIRLAPLYFEYMASIDVKEIDIKKTGSGFAMRAWYRAETPFVGNVSMVADFDKTVEVKSGAGA